MPRNRKKNSNSFKPTLVAMENDFVRKENRNLIDGSSLEGGGQILRNCVSLSALLGIPIEVVNIRGKRDTPGLRPQHLHGINLIASMFQARFTGGKVKSMNIQFEPPKEGSQKLLKKQYEVDTQTAGSTSLLIQIAMPCIIFAPEPVELILKGGTNASHAPQVDYILMVFKPIAERFGLNFELDIVKRGFFPQGGGIVKLLVKEPVKSLQPISLTEKGTLVEISCHSFVSGILSQTKVAERMSQAAKTFLSKEFSKVGINLDQIKLDFQNIKETENSAHGTGAGIILVAKTSTGCLIAGSSLGEKRKPAEEVGEEAARQLLFNWKQGGCVDEFLQDQLIVFMALANGVSKIRTGPLTLHTRTTIHFSSCMTGAKFNISSEKENENSPETTIIECQGIHFQVK